MLVRCDVDVVMSYHCLFRKPVNVPSARSLDIFYDQLKACKVQSGNGVKGDIEKYEGPFEEGVDGVSLDRIS